MFHTQNLVCLDTICYPDLHIKKDVVTFITGESGCGKSSLLKLLNQTLRQSRGEIFYKGQALDSLDIVAHRREVLLVSQEVFLFDGSIESNFQSFYHMRKLPCPSVEILQQFLNLCCLPLPLFADAKTMSGGERGRLYLAIFLSFSPSVLLLDEPTSALDNATGHGLMKQLLAFCRAQNTTVVIVSHDQSLVTAFAEDCIHLERKGD